MKGHVYMKASKVKNIDKYAKKELTIRIWDKKKYTKRVHPQHGLTDSFEDIIYLRGSNNDGTNDKWNK